MMAGGSGQDRRTGVGSSPHALYKEVMEHIDKAFALPPDQLAGEVDEAERRVAGLRDCFIEKLRADLDAGEETRWRGPLDAANVALGLIASVEFPGTGVHKSYLEQAKKILSEMERQLEELV